MHEFLFDAHLNAFAGDCLLVLNRSWQVVQKYVSIGSAQCKCVHLKVHSKSFDRTAWNTDLKRDLKLFLPMLAKVD